MNVGLLESHKTYERQQNEDQQVDHLLPPSGESGSEYGLLDIEQKIKTQRERRRKSMDVRRHGLYRKREAREGESKHAVKSADTQRQPRHRKHLKDEYGDRLTGEDHKEYAQKHVPDGSRQREMQPMEEQQDQYQPDRRECQRPHQKLAGEGGHDRVAGGLQQMPGGTILKLRSHLAKIGRASCRERV